MILDKIFIQLRKPGHRRYLASRVLSWYGRTFIKGPRPEDVPKQVGPDVQERVARTYFDLPVDRFPSEEMDHWNIGQLWATQLRISEEPHVGRAAFICSAVLCTAIFASGTLVHNTLSGIGSWVEQRKAAAETREAAKYQERRAELLSKWEKEASGYSAQRCIDEVSELRVREKQEAADRYSVLQKACASRVEQIEGIAQSMPQSKCVSLVRDMVNEIDNGGGKATWIDNIIAPVCGSRFRTEITEMLSKESK